MDIMLDLETWGKKPGCDIRSIGACVFNPATGYVADPTSGYNGEDYPNLFYIATHNLWKPAGLRLRGSRQYPLTRDPDTVQWWSEQSDEAQAAFANPVDLAVALRRFSNWLDHMTQHLRPIDGDVRRPLHKCDVVRIWSHGPAFDPPILAAAFDAVGLPVPWHYRAPRDTRTCFDMAGIDDHSAWLAQHPGPLGIAHHALDDAICQARGVCGAASRMRGRDDLISEAYQVVGTLAAMLPDDPEITRALDVLSEGYGSLLPFNPDIPDYAGD